MAPRTLLTAEQLSAALAGRPNWSGDAAGIARSFPRVPLLQAARMVDELAVIAEDLDHHPDIDIRWRTLRIFLTTHSAGGVTELDLEYARRVDEAFDLPALEDRHPALQRAIDQIEKQFGAARAGRPVQPDSDA